MLWPLVLSQWEILIIDPWEIDETTHCPTLPSDSKYLPVLELLKPFLFLEFGHHSLGRGGFKEALSQGVGWAPGSKHLVFCIQCASLASF